MSETPPTDPTPVFTEEQETAIAAAVEKGISGWVEKNKPAEPKTTAPKSFLDTIFGG